LLGWRDVPTNNDGLSAATIAVEPLIRQVFVARGAASMSQDDLERKLYIIRKRSGHAIQALQLRHGKEFYVPSFSTRTIVYKGMLLAEQVGHYYRDLQDPSMVTALALVHQRFSTNTFPTWDLSHPFRMVAHNGEINTLRGNVNWIRARQQAIASPVLKEDLKKIWPLIYDGQSDSASFDNCLEMLVMGGYSLAHAMMMMIPEAWSGHRLMDEDRKAFYEYHATLMEAWDGPAAMAFTDGRQIGATLDRNGLRPARYVLTDDDMVVLASEAGVLDIPESKIVKKWRLQPGRMFLVDIEKGCIVDDVAMKHELATAKPYREWVQRARIRLDDLPEPAPAEKSAVSLLDRQQAFGYTQEDLKIIMAPMAANGQEATGSMGNDSPLAVMSDKPRNLYHYFKQLFAQVTNPPIDPIREELVMSTAITIGPRPNLLDIEHSDPGMWLEVPQPVLTVDDMEKIRHIDLFTGNYFRSHELDITYPAAWGTEGIEAAVASLCAHAEDALRLGFNLLIVTDRKVSPDRVPIPALLAVGAIHQHLVKKGLRTSTGLVVETGSAREVHHFALLGGYGAAAVHPYLALETLHQMRDVLPGISPAEAEKKYIKAISKGLLKVMSKMGISTYQSYCGAQIFEAVGLSSAFVNQYFSGTASNVEGIGIFEIAEEAMRLHAQAFSDDPVLRTQLDAGGEYAYRVRGEEHMWTPDAIAKLQHSTKTNSYATYQEYARLINDQTRRHMTLRGLFDLKSLGPPVPLAEVEAAKDIVKRFATGAMSLGSISTEAHTTLAVAMNRIGGKSNTGEGGEDPKRYVPIQKVGETLRSRLGDAVVTDIPLQIGDSLRSKIKQVASARFGVTAEYLNSADQIQIKMAQGAKPGEGGQLPGHKVSEYIGRLRYATPGVELISPPPHHDIYSIEDLAQLIHDLKNCNSQASISVKLVSEVGVGTVAAGVAKAKADHVTIAGHDGGTGASPVSSVKHAGTPWELGLAETQQTLVLNRLRGRIAVQVDGQLKTGRDVMIGALLGADEFGFATAPLVVAGCIMMRKCHLNTCPVGVATQDPLLRAKFSGQPEHVVNYFFFVAEEVRELMAAMGVRRFEDLIGRADLLDTRRGIDHWKARGLDFARVFHLPEMPAADRGGPARHHCEQQQHGLENALDNGLIAKATAALEKGERVVIQEAIRNGNRTVGTMLSGAVARRYGHAGLADDTIHIALTGTAGQSIGAFLARGVTLDLTGQANDYVGKGLSGGRIVVRPATDFHGDPMENIIVGNTVLYGAIAGEAFFRGVAGERFCVRNSGASAVVEGTGDHGCEYMTGGTVVVLGRTGRNFAAGMSGGVAFVLDEQGDFEKYLNPAMVQIEPVSEVLTTSSHLGMADAILLKSLIENHGRYTGSERAISLLANWPLWSKRFVKVMPTEYKRALSEQAAKKAAGFPDKATPSARKAAA
ncbi:MAG: glutamate synthase subunit alpha, partial [Betaproteobacteria bacterium]|nr:glutamate synthase subunit alpha [Betaproteobacteria bacterium]